MFRTAVQQRMRIGIYEHMHLCVAMGSTTRKAVSITCFQKRKATRAVTVI